MARPRPAVHRTILVVDVEGFGNPRRTDLDQLGVRRGLYWALEQAFGDAGIPWAECQHEDRGDGVLVLAPPEVPKAGFAEALPGALVSAVGVHNAAHPVEEQFRLRMALHAGEVSYDEHGVTAGSLNLAFRLADAPALKEALAGSPGVLALIVSSWFFAEVVRNARAAGPATYRRAGVEVKETSVDGWIALPDYPYPPRQDEPGLGVRGRLGDGRSPACPYRGLVAYEESDAALFYGRESRAVDLLTMLAGRQAGAGVLVVTGASGAGKSSLLRAGLLPAVGRGELPIDGSARWPRMVMTPTSGPVGELAARLASLRAGANAAQLRQELVARPETAHLLLRQAQLAGAGNAGRGCGSWRLVLVVDQAEELFTLCEREHERRAFVTALHAMAANPAGPEEMPPALVVLGLRGDFLERCSSYPELAGTIEAGMFLVGPMTLPELTQVITGPAAAAGLRIEPGLVETVLADLRPAGAAAADSYETGALPLLSHALLATWNNRDGHRLTIRGYGRTGGLRRAVQDSAEAVYASLTPAQQQTARVVFSQLIAVTTSGQVTRRRVPMDELLASGQAEVTAILDRFAAQRLVVLHAADAEIAHDALPAAWDRLQRWLADDRALLVPYQRLADDAGYWAASGHDRAFLYRGTRLAAAQEALARWNARPGRFPALTATQARFLEASAAAAARGRRWRRLAAGALATATAVAGTAAGIAISQAAAANHERDIAVARQATAQSEAIGDANPALSQLLSVAAWRLDPTPAARFGMTAALVRPEIATLAGPGPVNSVAYSPDGRTIAVEYTSGVVWLWDTVSHRRIGAAFTGSAHTPGTPQEVAFSPDGRDLAIASGDGHTVRLWNVAAHRQIGSPFTSPPSGPPDMAVAFSRNGRTLATATGGRTVQLWDVATHHLTGNLIMPGPDAEVSSVAFSPGGRIVAVAGAQGAGEAGVVWLWDAASHRVIGVIKGRARPGALNSGIRLSVAFSRDGHTLAAAGGGGTVWLCDVGTRRLARGLDAGPVDRNVDLAAFSPDGRTLATGGDDGAVRLWDLPSHTFIGVAVSNGLGFLRSVVFSPDGRTLAAGGDDGRVHLADVAVDHQIGAVRTGDPRPPGLTAVTFSPDGKIIATAGSDGVRLRDAATGRQIGPILKDTHRPVPPHAAAPLAAAHNAAHACPDPFDGLAFSSDGRTLTAGDGDRVVRWDVDTHHAISSSWSRLNGSAAWGFGRNGRVVVGAGTAIGVWDATTNHTIRYWDITNVFPDQPTSAALSPDGHTLATAGDNAILLWDINTHRHTRTIAGAGTVGIGNMAFSPDGHTLATVGENGTVRLWDVATGSEIGPLLGIRTRASSTPAICPVFAPGIEFSTDGHSLATVAQDGIIRLWDVPETQDQAVQLCARANRNLTRKEWSTYLPGVPYRRVCP